MRTILDRSSARLALGAALTLVVTACAGNVPIRAPSIDTQPFPEAGVPSYELQVGDAIAVKFWGYPELDEELTIRPDGKISMPFVDEVQAADLTPAELDAELTRRYTGELASPQITVIVRKAAGHLVYIGGHVNRSGLIELSPKLTLFQAIQVAGGLAEQARAKQVLLIRTFPDGSRLARALDLRPLMGGQDPSSDVLLQPFDVVFVPPRKIEGFDTFVAEYLDPIYNLLPIRIVGTIDLFPAGESIFD